LRDQPDLRFWRAGVTIPIPLWDRRQGQIGEVQAAISQANAVLDQRRLELISALERAYEHINWLISRPPRSKPVHFMRQKAQSRRQNPHIALANAALSKCWTPNASCKTCAGTCLMRNLRVSRRWWTWKNLARLPLE